MFQSSGGEKDGSRRVPSVLSVETHTTTFALFLALISTFLLTRVWSSLARNSLGSWTPCCDQLLGIHTVLVLLLGWPYLSHWTVEGLGKVSSCKPHFSEHFIKTILWLTFRRRSCCSYFGKPIFTLKRMVKNLGRKNQTEMMNEVSLYHCPCQQRT